MRNHKLFSTVLGLLSLSIVACGSGTQSDDDDGADPGTVNPGQSGGGGQAAPDAAVPPGCDATKTPSQDACVVNETLGVFVAPASADAAADSPDGTRGHPFTKMQDAIDAAKNQKKRVYACAGTYAEQIVIADGVSMFGDLDCNQSWSVVTDKHASVNAPASPAARADQIQSATRIESIDIVAPDGTSEAPSSIALIATSSPALVIASSTIHAGKGMNGADGVQGEQLSNAASANGVDNSNALLEDCSGFSQNPTPCWLRHRTASAGGTNACLGSSRSFVAGSGASGGTAIGDAVVASGTTFFEFGNQYYMTPAYLATDGNAAGSAAGGVRGNAANAAGTNGASGATGANGASAAAAGAISAQGFVTADGTAGGDGQVGQGGAGGAGYDYVTESSTSYPTGDAIYFTNGGGGGAGGCPGVAGTAGKGGGASIAIIAVDSPITLDTCNVQASDAGEGGKGTFGSNASGGGIGGADHDPGACNPTGFINCLNHPRTHEGGNGGSGGNSGWSGSGAGGSSIGIAYRGAQVVLVSSVPTNGAAGVGVAAMTSGAKTIPATPAGVASLAVSF
ncbi:MAG: hypothetical protein ACRELY_21805 [Polyangiaceae bacterium]